MDKITQAKLFTLKSNGECPIADKIDCEMCMFTDICDPVTYYDGTLYSKSKEILREEKLKRILGNEY